MPPSVSEAALLATHGTFTYRKGENSGYWTMPSGPSVSESNGVATLEGKLRIGDGFVSSTDSNAINESNSFSHSGDFESALTATICLKIRNYSFTGSHIEAVNFNQRLPQS